MISILIMAIMFMAVASATGYAIISLTNSTSSFYKTQNEVDLLNKWESVIANSLRPYGANQTLVAPYGVNNTQDKDSNGVIDHPYMTLPDLPSAIGLSKKNTFGREIIYCPLAPNPVTGASVVVNMGKVEGDDNSYDAELNSFENNIKYVVGTSGFSFSNDSGSALQNMKILAILISPLKAELPSCSDIRPDLTVVNSEGIPSGVVRVVTQDAKYSNSINKPIYIKSSDSALYGQNPTLNDLFNGYAATQPPKFIVDLYNKGSNYAVSGNIIVKNSFPGESKQIVLKGLGSNTTISASSLSTITFENVDVLLSNVTFGNNVKINLINSKIVSESAVTLNTLNMKDSELKINGNLNIFAQANTAFALSMTNSFVKNYGYNVTINGTSLIGSASAVEMVNSKFESNGGSISVNPYANSQIGFMLSDYSSAYIDSASISYTRSGSTYGASLFSVDDSSSLTLSGQLSQTSVFIDSAVDSAIFSNGKLSFDNINLSFGKNYNTAINVSGNGELMLSNSIVGTSARANTSATIKTNGAKFIGGTGSTIYGQANRCWNYGSTGEAMFELSSQENSQPVNDLSTLYKFLRIVNQSNWTCN